MYSNTVLLLLFKLQYAFFNKHVHEDDQSSESSPVFPLFLAMDLCEERASRDNIVVEVVYLM